MSRKLMLLGVLMVLAVGAVAGCRAAQAPPPERTVEVRLGELYFKPAPLTLRAGETVAVQLVNEGQVEHEFMIGREVDDHSGKPDGFEKDFFTGVKVAQTSKQGQARLETGHGTMMTLPPGAATTIVFTVPADRGGEWQLGCFVPGHYEAGMQGKLIVE